MKRSTCAAMVLVCILSFDYDGIVAKLRASCFLIYLMMPQLLSEHLAAKSFEIAGRLFARNPCEQGYIRYSRLQTVRVQSE
jgi:hypothetical protein